VNRRTALVAAGSALPLLGGCLAVGSGDPHGTADRTDGSSVTADRTDGRPTGSGPVRGESPVEVRASVTEDDERVEYVDANESVRYVAAWRHTNQEEVRNGSKPEREPVYEWIPFERRARTECVSAAAAAAADHANEALGTDAVGGGTSSGVGSEDLAAVVSVTTLLDPGGAVLSEPTVGFDDLVASTPATVHATYRIEGRAFDRDVPVYAEHVVLQQQ